MDKEKLLVFAFHDVEYVDGDGVGFAGRAAYSELSIERRESFGYFNFFSAVKAKLMFAS